MRSHICIHVYVIHHHHNHRHHHHHHHHHHTTTTTITLIPTPQVEGRSLYGLILKFVRVLCRITRDVTELAVVKWFAPPTYPDGDPLLVKIRLDHPPPPTCETFLFLEEIDPTPVIFELVNCERDMFVMRTHGLDIVPDY